MLDLPAGFLHYKTRFSLSPGVSGMPVSHHNLKHWKEKIQKLVNSYKPPLYLNHLQLTPVSQGNNLFSVYRWRENCATRRSLEADHFRIAISRTDVGWNPIYNSPYYL